MKQQEMADFMEKIFKEEIQETRAQGQKEYAGNADADAFANFKRLATDLDMDQKKILWVYAMKHRDGIANWLNGHESQREDVTGRIKDLIIYLFLLWGMIEEERESNKTRIQDPYFSQKYVGINPPITLGGLQRW